MSLLFDDIADVICELVRSASSDVLVLSAFVSVAGLEKITSHMAQPGRPRLRVLTRWAPSDFALGSADLRIYPYLQSLGAELRISEALHAKVIAIDGVRGMLGSANVTGRGLGIVPRANIECVAFMNLTSADVRQLESLWAGATPVGDTLFAALTSAVAGLPPLLPAVEWPAEVRDALHGTASSLMAADFPWEGVPPNIELRWPIGAQHFGDHDRSLLGIWGGEIDRDRARKVAELLPCFRWLRDLVAGRPEKTCHFGELTSQLHDLLADDPTPYRREVKQILGATLSWVSAVHPFGLAVDTPGRRSQRVFFE